MPVRFKLLHLTDLHLGMESQRDELPRIREIFLRDVRALVKHVKSYDAVLFTGDLVQKGDPEEFLAFDAFSRDLWTALGATPILLAVPGNHDIQRSDSRRPAVRLLTSLATEGRVEDWADLEDPATEYRTVIDSAFAAYSNWWRERCRSNSALGVEIIEGLLPGDFSTVLTKDNARLGLIGLNSTFLQLTGGNYEGKLALHPNQVHRSCQTAECRDIEDWAKRVNTSVLMTHQPPSWLTEENRTKVLRGLLDVEGRFACHLAGHLHEAEAGAHAESWGFERRLIRGGSLFGIEPNPLQPTRRIHAYACIEIEVRERQGRIRIWPRLAYQRESGEWSFGPDQKNYRIENHVSYTAWKTFPLLTDLKKPAAKKRRSDEVDTTASKLDEKVRYFDAYVDTGHYDEAWTYFRDDINYTLDFRLSQNHKHLHLLLRLLPHGEGDSRLDSISDQAGVLNALARAYKNIGRPQKAVDVYRHQLDIQRTSRRPNVTALGNLANALRLTGKLFEAENAAREMFEKAAEVNQPIWEAYGLYWNGVLLAGRGAVADGVLLLRQAQVLFEQINDPIKHEGAAGTGRCYAHLAQIELWQGNARVALVFAKHAMQLVEEHRQERERIFAARLIGMAGLNLGMRNSRHELLLTLENAIHRGYFEEELAAAIGLAEDSRRSQDFRAAREFLSEDRRSRAEAGGYSPLLADFDTTLCQIELDQGHHNQAADAAARAYRRAWCDGPPFSYQWGVERASSLLARLGAPLPEVRASRTHPPYLLRDQLSSILDTRETVRAKSRADFTKRLREITGPYRYAPNKFIQMLHEDWAAIRAIIEGRGGEVNVPPQFIEIHVGEPCNLACLYCRGELRKVRESNRFLPTDTLLALIRSIHHLNRRAFLRFSGLIGEPLLHPEIVAVLDAVNATRLNWGLTTNGVKMVGNVLLAALLGAEYVHVSVDAGSQTTYASLKGGVTGDYEKVLDNIESLAQARGHNRRRPEIIVSFLLQETNYRELPVLAERAKALGVDTLEIKMQHFDRRRKMSAEAVSEAYDLTAGISKALSDATFRMLTVQDRSQALTKIEDGVHRVPFEKCYANLLGLNPTVDPKGELQVCCQYYQGTLEAAGNVGEEGLESIWSGKRLSQLNSISLGDPRVRCVNCSPSDEFVNNFSHFMSEAHRRDASFLDWVEREALIGGTGGQF